MEPTARSLALDVLNGYQPQKTNLSSLIAARMVRLPPDFPDRGFARDLIWGVVRHLNTLDHFINHFTDDPDRIELPVRNVLRLGVLQIVFLGERVPHYAAVDESVKLAGQVSRGRAGSLVNAVLRTIIRKEQELPWPKEDDSEAKAIAIRYSHPVWLVSRWLKRYGREETVRLCQTNNTPAHLTVRANTMRITREDLKKRLNAEGVLAESSAYSPDGLILLSNPELEKLESYREGLFIFQSEASQLVAHILDPQPGETVVDICCGSGVKTTHIAQIARGQAHIIAVDTSTEQLTKARDIARFWSVSDEVTTVQADARNYSCPEADRVLADVPCSSLGVLRRKPDIKWNRSETDVEERYPQLQKAILFNAARLVKMGGTLVYSTCTTEPEENDAVIREFLLTFPDYRLEEIRFEGRAQDLMAANRFFFSTLPHRHGVDGFFAAKLRRR